MNHAAYIFNHLVVSAVVFWVLLMVIAVVFAVVINWLCTPRPRDEGLDLDDDIDEDS